MIFILLSNFARRHRLWHGIPTDLQREIIMRINLVSILFIIAMVQVYGRAYSQITLQEKNTALENVLKSIEAQSGYVFFYNDEDLKNKKVTVSVKNVSIQTALDESFKNVNLIYKIDQKNVLIKKSTSDFKPIERLPELTATQQEIIIKGKVIDSLNRPISGVSISFKGTESKVSSLRDGSFEIKTNKSSGILVFSFLGMQSREIVVSSSNSNLIVTMVEQKIAIKDVVVTGYSNIRKESFTGTYTQVTKEQLLRVSSNNLVSALQVFDPSLRIMTNNQLGSDPNNLPEFYIRGQSGFPGVKDLDRAEGTGTVSQFALKNNPNLPVFILDGFEVNLEKIYDLDLNRIQQITILKDAAATAVYGSRASNGVIVVETIAPKPGEFRINYNGSLGVTAPDLSSYDMMNAQEKLDAEVAANLYVPHKDVDPKYYESTLATLRWNYLTKQNEINKGVDTYWLSQPLNTMINNKHTLYLEGGSEAIRLGLEFRYDQQGGVMKGSGRDRMGTGLTVEYRYKGLQVRNQTYFDLIKAKGSPFGSFGDYARMQPYFPIYNETDGSFVREYLNATAFGTENVKNPLYEASLGNINRNGYREWTNNISANWFVNKYFLIKGQFALNYKDADSERFIDPLSTTYARTGAFNKGELYLSETKNLNWNTNVFGSYNRVINENNINLSIGLNAKATADDYITSSYRGFADANFHSPAYAYEIINKPLLDDNKTRLLGSFANLNYSFKDIYLFDASFRLDGSSEFGSNRKWAPFWSLGSGINLHKSKLLEGNDWVNMFRIKANIGQTGKSNFSPFMARNTYKILLDDWYPTGIGANIIYMGNSNLTWEKQLSWNIGADLSIKNRHSFEFNYYNKTTYDLITDVSLPSSSGFTIYRDNIGKVLNKGFEMKATIGAVNTKDFNLILTGNIAHNKNSILEIAESLKSYNQRIDEYFNAYYITGGGSATYYISDSKRNAKYAMPIRKYEEGSSLTTIYGMKSLGINPANGKEVFLKRDGEVTYDWSPNEQQAIGNSEPWAQGSFGINARYKQFTLYSTFLYEFGGDEYNETLVNNVENVNLALYNADRRVLTDRWQKPGDIAPLKSIQDRYFVTRPTSRFIQKENFVVFNSLSLGYDFDPAKLTKYRVNSLRASILLNDIGRMSTIQREMGLQYPFARTFSFMLNASF